MAGVLYVLVLTNNALYLFSSGQDLSAEQRIQLLMFLVSCSKCWNLPIWWRKFSEYLL